MTDLSSRHYLLLSCDVKDPDPVVVGDGDDRVAGDRGEEGRRDGFGVAMQRTDRR